MGGGEGGGIRASHENSRRRKGSPGSTFDARAAPADCAFMYFCIRPPSAAGENPGGSHGAAMVCKKTRFTSASGVHRLCLAAEACLDTCLGDIFRPSSCFTRCGQPCWLSASQCDELTSRPALASQTLAETPETTPESGGTPAPARKGAKCFEAEYTYPMDVNVNDVGPLSLFHTPHAHLSAPGFHERSHLPQMRCGLT